MLVTLLIKMNYLQNFIDLLSNDIFETYYICFCIYFLISILYYITINPINQEINSLKIKQTILYKYMKKIKNTVDYNNTDIMKSELDIIRDNYEKIINMLEQAKYINFEEENEEEEEEAIKEREELTGIIFPHFRIYKSCLKQNNRIITKALSIQLTDFLGLEVGSCMIDEDIYYHLFKHINIDSNNKIEVTPRLQNLFNISGYNELTTPELSEFLKPHIKDI